ncbi:MAG: hypothetical protein K1X47_10420, partial [Cyclobacteriaceae bacterium]|nr:hypothetical protein [Cyclobacteriaceae bacterium]
MAFLLWGADALSQAVIRTNASGNWSNAATWVVVSGTDADGIPDADDDVIIRGAAVVTVDVNSFANSVQVGGTNGFPLNGSGVLTFAAGGVTLSVTGGVTVGGFNNTVRNGTINFVSGANLVASSLTFGNPGPTPSTNNTIDMTAG